MVTPLSHGVAAPRFALSHSIATAFASPPFQDGVHHLILHRREFEVLDERPNVQALVEVALAYKGVHGRHAEAESPIPLEVVWIFISPMTGCGVHQEDGDRPS